MPLDVTDGSSVSELAGEIGGKVDIVDQQRRDAPRLRHRRAPAAPTIARAEMDINYFGLLRLAQEFGPALRARGADGVNARRGLGQPAVDLRAGELPAARHLLGSKAAACRWRSACAPRCGQAGIRVVNVFPGPIDDEWNQLLPPPKLAPSALASAIVRALQQGVEDVYPGDVAQEWLARWRDNPKALERELG